MVQEIDLNGFQGGGARPHFLIAGPCVIENEHLVLDTAFQISEIAKEVGFPFIFKSNDPRFIFTLCFFAKIFASLIIGQLF